jgi:uncharacterized membrane protein YhaH (DUF805 family)
MFKKPFSFEGRIRRLEFGLSYIIYAIGLSIVMIVAESMPDTPIILLGIIPFLWFMLAQAAKRCHDRGNSAGFMFIPFYIFWLLFAESEHGENKYGPNPKGLGNYTEIDQIGLATQE